jgi:hypothetical protein
MTCMIKGAIIFLYFLLVETKFIDLLFGSGSRTKRNVIENKVRNNKKKIQRTIQFKILILCFYIKTKNIHHFEK